MGSWTYAKAGVSIRAGDEVVRRIAKLARRTHRPEVISGIGGFSGLFSLAKHYRDPVLVACTDGVGTKLKIAFSLGRHGTVGIDLVAMCVNDLITCGAEPLFFLDYFATGKLRPKQAESVLSGIVKGCEQSGCALLGGETAELPDFYQQGEYDLAGFSVGVVERKKMIDGSGIRPGDVILGLRSSGLHSNGYSLARRVLLGNRSGRVAVSRLVRRPFQHKTLGELLLEPTRIYVSVVRSLLSQVELKGIAHITGGGIPGNLVRILPEGVAAKIDTTAWVPHPIFSLIQEKGGVTPSEMFKTFNMGLGLMLVVSAQDVPRALLILKKQGEQGAVVGAIVRSKRRVILA